MTTRIHRLTLALIWLLWMQVTPSVASAGVNQWTTGGPPGEAILSLAIDPATPSTVYAGAELGRLFQSIDSGASWQQLQTGFLTGVNALAIDPTAPSVIYAGTDSGLFTSPDGGASWHPTTVTDAVIDSLLIDPAVPGGLYAGIGGGGAQGGVLYSPDAGMTWTTVGTGLPDTIVNALAITLDMPRTLYAATDDGLFALPDGNDSWMPMSTGLPQAAVYALAIDPLDPRTLYAGTESGAFMSTDGGASWSDAGLPSAVATLVIQGGGFGTLYAGTFGDGVFVNRGSLIWEPFNTGLSNGIVATLALDPGPPATLYAGTIGDGVFVQQLVPCLGDCDGSGIVSVDEILTMVNIATGDISIAVCPAADPLRSGMVSVAEVLGAVQNALSGCPAAVSR